MTNAQCPLILTKTPGNYPLRNFKEISTIKMKHRFLENSFFFATITEWNDFDYPLCNAPSINVFKENILKFIRFGPNKHLQSAWSKAFNENPSWLKSFTRSQI